MKKPLKLVLLGLALSILFVPGYFSVVILQARRETPKLIGQALNAEMALKVSDLSPWQRRALLAVEDPGFYRHHGVDLKTPGAGLTTITQGLVKMYYFAHFKPGIAKIKQTLIARYALDPLVSKDDQLTLFINRINLGSAEGKPVNGFAAAARAYYHKTVAELSEYEYLSLVAMIVAPQNFHLVARPAANAERTRRLARVVSGEYKPRQLMDIYYGKLDAETREGLAPASYFPGIYERA